MRRFGISAQSGHRTRTPLRIPLRMPSGVPSVATFIPAGSYFWPTGVLVSEGYPAIAGSGASRPCWVVAGVHAQGEDLGGHSVVSAVGASSPHTITSSAGLRHSSSLLSGASRRASCAHASWAAWSLSWAASSILRDHFKDVLLTLLEHQHGWSRSTAGALTSAGSYFWLTPVGLDRGRSVRARGRLHSLALGGRRGQAASMPRGETSVASQGTRRTTRGGPPWIGS
jgi:hypothetical protein